VLGCFYAFDIHFLPFIIKDQKRFSKRKKQKFFDFIFGRFFELEADVFRDQLRA